VRSPLREKSYGSVRVISVDREALADMIETLASRYIAHEEVLGVVLFGSAARREFSPGSDIDLLLILKDSPLPFLDRIPNFIPEDAPIDIEVFPYTIAEIERVPLAQEAMRSGRLLRAKPEAFEILPRLKEVKPWKR